MACGSNKAGCCINKMKELVTDIFNDQPSSLGNLKTINGESLIGTGDISTIGNVTATAVEGTSTNVVVTKNGNNLHFAFTLRKGKDGEDNTDKPLSPDEIQKIIDEYIKTHGGGGNSGSEDTPETVQATVYKVTYTFNYGSMPVGIKYLNGNLTATTWNDWGVRYDISEDEDEYWIYSCVGTFNRSTGALIGWDSPTYKYYKKKVDTEDVGGGGNPGGNDPSGGEDTTESKQFRVSVINNSNIDINRSNGEFDIKIDGANHTGIEIVAPIGKETLQDSKPVTGKTAEITKVYNLPEGITYSINNNAGVTSSGVYKLVITLSGNHTESSGDDTPGGGGDSHDDEEEETYKTAKVIVDNQSGIANLSGSYTPVVDGSSSSAVPFTIDKIGVTTVGSYNYTNSYKSTNISINSDDVNVDSNNTATNGIWTTTITITRKQNGEPNWVYQSHVCTINSDGKRTGEAKVTYIDKGDYSPTRNQTKEVTETRTDLCAPEVVNVKKAHVYFIINDSANSFFNNIEFNVNSDKGEETLTISNGVRSDGIVHRTYEYYDNPGSISVGKIMSKSDSIDKDKVDVVIGDFHNMNKGAWSGAYDDCTVEVGIIIKAKEATPEEDPKKEKTYTIMIDGVQNVGNINVIFNKDSMVGTHTVTVDTDAGTYETLTTTDVLQQRATFVTEVDGYTHDGGVWDNTHTTYTVTYTENPEDVESHNVTVDLLNNSDQSIKVIFYPVIDGTKQETPEQVNLQGIGGENKKTLSYTYSTDFDITGLYSMPQVPSDINRSNVSKNITVTFAEDYT